MPDLASPSPESPAPEIVPEGRIGPLAKMREVEVSVAAADTIRTLWHWMYLVDRGGYWVSGACTNKPLQFRQGHVS